MTRIVLFGALLSAAIPLLVQGIPNPTNQPHSNSFAGSVNLLKRSLQDASASAVEDSSEISFLVRREPGDTTARRAIKARDSQEKSLAKLIKDVKKHKTVTQAHIELADNINQQRTETREQFRGHGAGRSVRAGKLTRKLGFARAFHEKKGGNPSQGSLDFLHRAAELDGEPPLIESLPKVV
jgi:hypothetical protein